MSGNAHVARDPESLVVDQLAYRKTCDGCGTEIFMAICRDGRWRPFETRRQPTPLPFTWAWRKRIGMEETDRVPGHLIHPCPAYHDRIDFGTVTNPHAKEAS